MNEPNTLSKCHNAPVVTCEGAVWDIDPEIIKRGSTYYYGCTECREACDLQPPTLDEQIDAILGQITKATQDASYGEWQAVGLSEAKQQLKALFTEHSKEVDRLARIDERKTLRLNLHGGGKRFNYKETLDYVVECNEARLTQLSKRNKGEDNE